MNIDMYIAILHTATIDKRSPDFIDGILHSAAFDSDINVHGLRTLVVQYRTGENYLRTGVKNNA